MQTADSNTRLVLVKILKILHKFVDTELSLHLILFSEKSYLVVTGGMNTVDLGAKKTVEVLEEPDCILPPLSYESTGHFMAMTSDTKNVLVCGGEAKRGHSNMCFQLDLQNNRWTWHSNMTHPRNQAVVVAMDSGIYVFGGMRSETTSNFLPMEGKSWIGSIPIPGGVYSACGLRISDREIMLIGGGSNNSKRIITLNTGTYEWQWRNFSKELEVGRSAHSCVLIGDKIMVIGGSDTHGHSISDTEIIPLDPSQPTIHASLYVPRKYFGVAILQDGQDSRLLAFGGVDSSGYAVSSVEEWNELDQDWKHLQITLSENKMNFGYLVISDSSLCGKSRL